MRDERPGRFSPISPAKDGNGEGAVTEMLRIDSDAQPTRFATRAHRIRGRGVALFDGFVGSDPGFNRFRAALQLVMTLGLALIAESLFVH